MALYPDDTIGLEIVDTELSKQNVAESAPAAEPDNLGGAVEQHIARYFAAHEGGLPPSGLYDRILREVEKPLIALSLAATRGNQIRAAALLGLNRNTLRKKIRDLDIEVMRGVKSE